MSLFKRAERSKAKLRLGLCGPSGAGKTMSALRLMAGLIDPPYEGKIAVIDTEHASASLYAHVIPFDTMVFEPPYDVVKLISAIHAAADAGYQGLIIDSITHFWAGEGGLLDEQSTIAKRTGNSYTAWRDVTPKQSKFIESILASPIHIIATMRSKVDYVMETNDRGKQVPKKVGLAPIQREGMDYEFTTVFDIGIDGHLAAVSKDRTGIFDGWLGMITEETGKKMRVWLEEGGDPVPTFNEIVALYRKGGLADEAIVERVKTVTGRAGRADLTDPDYFALKADALALKVA